MPEEVTNNKAINIAKSKHRIVDGIPEQVFDPNEVGKGRLAPVHFNRNLLCAVDTGTTGLIPGKHELIRLAIIPLKADYTPSKEFKWFDIWVRPEDSEQGDMLKGWRRDKFTYARLHGMERWAAVDFFRNWFDNLKLHFLKRLTPLGHNYQFDLQFLTHWLGGPECYDEFFRHDYRDTQNLALAWNDVAESHNDYIPYPKYTLSYLCACLQVENLREHDAVSDAYTTAEVYRRLMSYNYWYRPSKLSRSAVLLAPDLISLTKGLTEITDKILIPGSLSGDLELDKRKIEFSEGVITIGTNPRIEQLSTYALEQGKTVHRFEVKHD